MHAPWTPPAGSIPRLFSALAAFKWQVHLTAAAKLVLYAPRDAAEKPLLTGFGLENRI